MHTFDWQHGNVGISRLNQNDKQLLDLGASNELEGVPAPLHVQLIHVWFASRVTGAVSVWSGFDEPVAARVGIDATLRRGLAAIHLHQVNLINSVALLIAIISATTRLHQVQVGVFTTK